MAPYLHSERKVIAMGLAKALKTYDFTEYKEFDVGLITIDPVVRDMCRKNVCGHYGANHMCPPAVKSLEHWQAEIVLYEKAVLITKAYQTKGLYDTSGWLKGMTDFQKRLALVRKDFLKQFPEKRMLLLGAGACSLCKKCTFPEGAPCRLPQEAFPSLEACGIDVVALTRRVGVRYNNGRDTVTYIGAALWNSPANPECG